MMICEEPASEQLTPNIKSELDETTSLEIDTTADEQLDIEIKVEDEQSDTLSPATASDDTTPEPSPTITDPTRALKMTQTLNKCDFMEMTK